AAVEHVTPLVVEQLVTARATRQVIVARAAEQLVFAGATGDPIVPRPCVQLVRTGAAGFAVIAATAVYPVAAAGARELIGALAADLRLVRGVGGGLHAERRGVDRIARGEDPDRPRAGPPALERGVQPVDGHTVGRRRDEGSHEPGVRHPLPIAGPEVPVGA